MNNFNVRDQILKEIEKSAQKGRFIPICGSAKGKFLQMLVRMKQPKKILELGTAIGYSTILMASAAPKARIDTVDIDEDVIQEAKENFKKADLKNVNVRLGDARNILINARRKYDFILLDVAKSQYLPLRGRCISLLNKNGVLVADNTLWEGLKQ